MEGGQPELFKSEFSDSEVEAEDEETEEVETDDEMPPPMEDELMSNPLMSDLSSLNNPPPSNSQTQHKSLYDRKINILLHNYIKSSSSALLISPSGFGNVTRL